MPVASLCRPQTHTHTHTYTCPFETKQKAMARGSQPSCAEKKEREKESKEGAVLSPPAMKRRGMIEETEGSANNTSKPVCLFVPQQRAYMIFRYFRGWSEAVDSVLLPSTVLLNQAL